MQNGLDRMKELGNVLSRFEEPIYRTDKNVQDIYQLLEGYTCAFWFDIRKMVPANTLY
jgi:hypothetical protein